MNRGDSLGGDRLFWCTKLTQELGRIVCRVNRERLYQLCSQILVRWFGSGPSMLWVKEPFAGLSKQSSHKDVGEGDNQPPHAHQRKGEGFVLMAHHGVPLSAVDLLLHIPERSPSAVAMASREDRPSVVDSPVRLAASPDDGELLAPSMPAQRWWLLPLAGSGEPSAAVFAMPLAPEEPAERPQWERIASVAADLLQHARAEETPCPDSNRGDQLSNRLLLMLQGFLTLLSNNSFEDALEAIAHLATTITNSRYGAVGVLGEDHQLLSHFVVTSHSCSGVPPTGRGVLGALLSGKTLRMADLAKHSMSVGFPEGHPPMKSFLGVPVFVRGTPFGNLYVTEKNPPAEAFTPEDERALEDLAVQVGLAIEYKEMFSNRHQEELVRAFLDASPQGIFFIDSPEGNLVASNRQAEQMIGTTLTPGLGGTERILSFGFHQPDGQLMEKDALPGMRALKGATIRQMEVVTHRATGERIPFWASAAPTQDRNGEINGAVVILEDISNLKNLERLRDEFASAIAHDLRTPLATVMGHTDLLRRRLQREGREEGDKLVSSTHSIKGAVRQLQKMIDDLSDYTRLESGKLMGQKDQVDLADLLGNLVRQMAPLFAKGMLHLDLHPPLPPISADPYRLEQLFSNLISNALRYAGEDKPVEVGAKSLGDILQVWVTDQGPGIAPEEQEHVFARYIKGSKSGKEGLGLGLYIARGIARSHGGELRLESSPGAGSTFVVELPSQSNQPATSGPDGTRDA